MAGQSLPKIKLWEISFAVFHLALRFDPFLLLACYLGGDLDFSQKHFNNGGQAKARYVWRNECRLPRNHVKEKKQQ